MVRISISRIPSFIIFLCFSTMQIPRSSSFFAMALLLVLIIILPSSSSISEASFHSESSSDSSNSIECDTVVLDLSPCAEFLENRNSSNSNAKPSDDCCKGVKEIDDSAKTKEDQIDVCNCIKREFTSGDCDNYNISRIPLLLKDCSLKIKLPPITNNTNCSM